MDRTHLERRTMRKNFFRSVAGLAAVFVLEAVQAQTVALPPRAEAAMPFFETLKRRMSVRSFSDKALDLEKVSWLLWAVKQMPPGTEAGELVVSLTGRPYVHDAEQNALLAWTGALPSSRMQPAPMGLFFMPKADRAADDALWFWRGMTGQAVYLGAAALSLGTVTLGGTAMPVGYPASALEFKAAAAPVGSNLAPVPAAAGSTFDAVIMNSIPGGLKHARPEEKLSAYLWAVYGFSTLQQGDRVHRTVPSARGRYPMELLVLKADGVMRYVPQQHCMESVGADDKRPNVSQWSKEKWIADAECLLVAEWDTVKLGSRGAAVYEAGCMAYTLWLAGRLFGDRARWALLSREASSGLAPVLGAEAPRIPFIVFGWTPEEENDAGQGKAGEAAGSAQTGTGVKTAALKDGVYTGEYREWPEMKVEVTVKKGRIAAVKVLEDSGTPEFSSQVTAALPAKMVAKGSPDVDAVSGATLSSTSLKRAVQEALAKAKEAPSQ